MTVLSAVQPAVVRTIGVSPTAVFSSTDQVALEMRHLLGDVALDIARSHDWRDLTEIATFTGDGVTTEFAKPADYDRMVQASDMDDPNQWFWGYYAVPSLNQWMRRQSSAWISPGGWIILGGAFNFYPAPPGDAEFPYISNLIARSEDGTPKAAFTADDDTFVLDERLLTLGLIWRYRAQKGLEYAEDMMNYERALSERQGKDGGAKTIRRREGGNYNGARPAWPLELG